MVLWCQVTETFFVPYGLMTISVVFYLSHVMRKSVFGVYDQVRLKPACSATVTSWGLAVSAIASRGIILSRQRKQRRWSDCADAQADLRLCCSHMAKTGFLMTGLIWHRETLWSPRSGKWELVALLATNLNRRKTKPTKWHVRPAKTQISLGIRQVWSESSLSAWRRFGS